MTRDDIISMARECADEICDGHGRVTWEMDIYGLEKFVDLIAPAQREWQGLTDDEKTYLAWESNNGSHCVEMTEAKLKAKNGF